jgi:hypothetical protein
MSKQNMTSLLNFRHRIVLSRSYTESPTPESTDIVIVREAIKEVWASVTPVKGSFYVNGQAMQENRNAFSHYIVIRYNRDMDITGYAWIYETRPSGKRWYKVLAVEEMGERERFWQIQARLTQKSDLVNPPGNIRHAELPQGAQL